MPFEPAEMESLTLTVDRKIAHVELNRPDKRNAMNRAFWDDLPRLMDALSERSDVRAVVISGRGAMFTAGLDLTMAQEFVAPADADPGRVREKLRRTILAMQDTFTAIERCRVPVIAAIHGGCLGGGVDLVTACDLRFAAADAYFTIQEINIAMVADVGTLQRAPHLLPHGVLRELAYTGRPMTADEAAGYGFVNAVLPDREATLDRAFETAHTIAAKSPLAVTGTKQVINHARDHNVADGLDYVATWNAGLLMNGDLMKGMSAALSKSPAAYDDLAD
ncbi:enoyl-CoA hydratase [Rhodothalassium salexigens DSM 2132]|uniref:Enoyl-CoA hydratase n=1 Tax=Rhodothalassium salexigens DSM 2132 TaxID=1188247 RepID=A0A4R2PMS1_RHOSA|nr:crotonase/enoyl-CoA hydratase family protein [Rhodothalassium salexigens]MBB4211425.1 enoyl-CoA hydratase [Rhodothalassium salexigens DSM 2132]MBK1637756.1 enoyl-CoA hydratase [Rhodothalassium salexigens DSM 2132]TCP35345.1 enoyl-CoA hydratase [Rhodothalassium salexigens DSM 2132]